MQLLTVALVALMLCSAAMATYNQCHSSCTVVSGNLLGGLLTVVADIVGLVAILLFDVSTFFIENGRIYCRGRTTMQGLPGGDKSCYNAYPVQHVECHRDAEGNCQLLSIVLEVLSINVLGIEAALKSPLVVTVSADSEYLLGDVLCDLLGPTNGDVYTLPATDMTKLNGMLGQIA